MNNNKQDYCLGFIFNKDLDRVLLIKKNRGPKDIVGKLNGIGGKIEVNEQAIDAMVRESKEETGLDILAWKGLCILDFSFGKIYCYYVVTDDIFNYKQIEDEIIDIYDISKLDKNKSCVVSNINWLIPMAINSHKDFNYYYPTIKYND